MKIVVSVEHPAWAYQFRYLIKSLKNNGHTIKVLAIKKDIDLELLQSFNIPYEIVGNTTGEGIIQKAWLLVSITFKIFLKCLFFKPDIFIGRSSPMMAINSFLFAKPHIIFEDTEHSHISLFFCKLFTNIIITPNSFRTNLGKAQKRFPVYKELFYLHPNRFSPNEMALNELGIKKGECFILMRFVAWKADHDFGHKGLSAEMKMKAVEEFCKFGKVFITSEEPLTKELEAYRIKLSPEKIHHIMYYSTLLFGESSTMASECAVLGIHSIFCDFTGRGYTDEQEKRFDLVYNFRLDSGSQKKAIEKGIELLQNKNLWNLGKEKQKKLLAEMADGTALFLEQLQPFLNNK
jgi:predicted glycosyltransferase